MLDFCTKIADRFNSIPLYASRNHNSKAELFWILSSRHDAEKRHINCAIKSKQFNIIPVGLEISGEIPDVNKCDIEDDYIRIIGAFNIARKQVAKQLNKPEAELTRRELQKYAPIIVYNGFEEQNLALKRVLSEPDAHNFPIYPSNKVLIFDMPHDNQNTAGQFISFYEKRKTGVLNTVKNVTIVTSGYHVPRVESLMCSEKYPKPFLDGVNYNFYVIDPDFERSCAVRDVIGEMLRLYHYANQGYITIPDKSKTYMPGMKGLKPNDTVSEALDYVRKFRIKRG